MTTQEAVDSFLTSRSAKGLSAHTIRWYKNILSRFAVMYINLPQDTASLERFLQGCRAKDERRHGYYRAIKAFYRWLARRRLAVGEVIFALEAPQRTRKEKPALTPGELTKLLDYPHKPAIRAALIFLADTGCRLGELHTLLPESFYQWGGQCVVTICGKTGPRTIPVSNISRQLLTPHLPFSYNRDWLGRQVSASFRAAGVHGSAHTLRHTFGTLWQGDIGNLQRILGHSSIFTTMIYRHTRLETLQGDHAAHSPIKRLPLQLPLW